MNPQPIEVAPRLHNEIYSTISPDKFSNSFNGQVVVVTGETDGHCEVRIEIDKSLGASGTIGQAIAQSFARAGADLYLVAFKSPNLEDIKEKCLYEGAGRVVTGRYDLSQPEACESLQRDAIDAMGHVDVLVNNAGVPGVRMFHTQNPSDFTKDIAVNLHGPVHLLRLFLPHFMDRRMGCVINVVSRAGTVDVPFNSSYSTSKAALIRLTGCVQMEVDMLGLHDIHLYAMHPGAVLTGITKGTYDLGG
ncbi:hypothetical protein BFJ70_g16061 [Fusarium oxysporum]|nr:hypothetical protein BFJ70_g16061 [Fusarium oxysporum]